MSFLKTIDPIYFHHDVLNTLDTVNSLKPKTLLGTVFVKKPAQLFLACFSSVLSVVAAVREAFVALGAFFVAATTFLYSKTRALIQKDFRGEVKGWEECKFHAYRAGSQLLSLPVSLAGIPGVFYNTFEWVVDKHIQLHNYTRAEEQVHQAPEPIVERPPPVLPRRSEDGIANPLPPPPRAPEASKVPPLPKSAAKNKGVKFESADAARSPAPEPILKEAHSRDHGTIRRKLSAGIGSSGEEPPEVFVEVATYKGHQGWYATKLNINYLSEHIEDFKLETLLDEEFDVPINDLFDYIAAEYNDRPETGKTYTLESWNIYVENLEEEERFPKVFIYRNPAPEGLQLAAKRSQGGYRTVRVKKKNSKTNESRPFAASVISPRSESVPPPPPTTLAKPPRALPPTPEPILTTLRESLPRVSDDGGSANAGLKKYQ